MKSMFYQALKALMFFFLAGMTALADAQLVTYQFTGSASGNAGMTISGTITLDVGVASDSYYTFNESYDDGSVFSYDYRGFTEYWFGGRFSINAITNTGLAAGTALGGETGFFQVSSERRETYSGVDYYFDLSGSQIFNTSFDEANSREVHVSASGFDRLAGGVTPGQVANPWDPKAKELSYIQIYEYNSATGEYIGDNFSIDTFTLVPATIVIDGIDTGIDDFPYQGKLVSEHLGDCAASARNHGDYISCVDKLINALVKAGQLTGRQKGIIIDAAAKSSYGR